MARPTPLRNVAGPASADSARMSAGPARMTARRAAALGATIATVAAVALVASTSAALRDEPAAGASAEPPAQFDVAETFATLDVFGARFGQISSSDLSLSVRTYGPWEPKHVFPSPVNGLCLYLRRDGTTTPGGRLCVVPNDTMKSGVGLRYTALDHAGNRLGIRDLSIDVRRPQPTIVSARFSPALLRLVPGTYHWYLRSVTNGVEDRLPDKGDLPLRIAVSTAPAASERCFGAASRDRRHRCTNGELRRAVVPTPDEAVVSQNSPCTPIEIDKLVSPCEFGLPAADAKATVALIGDSHASHWRSALEHVSQRKRWSGVSITRSGCPLTRVSPKLEPESRRQECLRWNRQVPRWLERHPQISTIFVVAHAALEIVDRDDRNPLDAKVDGFLGAWKALPKSVTRIIVIRDTPSISLNAFECVDRKLRKRRDAGRECSVSRRRALDTDPAVIAAHRLNTKRVRVIDMSRYFCGEKRCYPVVGGALVYKDDQHMTEVFGTTLGPFLQRAIDSL